MNANTLSAIAGALLSLLFSYAPGFEAWYDHLDGVRKRQVMLALLMLAAAGSYAWACYVPTSPWSCDRAGIVSLLEALLAAVAANQATYLLSPSLPGRGSGAERGAAA